MLDTAGTYTLPGLIDPHVHFRDPSLTHQVNTGLTGVETLMQVMFSEAVLTRGISIQHFINLF